MAISIELAGRAALVTGAASGLGRACVDALQRAGATVVGLDKDRAGVQALRAEGVEAVCVDVTDRTAVDAAVRALPRLDIVVTAAGILQRPLAPQELPSREWARVLDVNLTGTFNVAAAAGARMAAGDGGAIVAISSITGLQPGPVHAYSAAKAGVGALVVSLAAEWGRQGVRVNAVAPGYVVTPALEKAVHFDVLDPDLLARVTALGRLVTVTEVADTVAFLASPLASGITGVTVPVDAGTLTLGGFAPFGRPIEKI